MQITIVYNESGEQVHKAGCGDLARLRGYKETFEAANPAEAAEAVWADQLDEGSCESIEEAVAWTTFKPCINF